MTATTANLLDHLQEQGYEPDASPGPDDWFDLDVSGIGGIRVVIHPRDDRSAEVHLFDAGWVCEWTARFSPGTPDAAIVAVIEAAERELAAKRGGPVTPAQASRA